MEGKDSMLKEHIGTQIKKLRAESSMTLKQLSDLTGLSVGFLSQLERGMTSVAIDTLLKIASVLGVSIVSMADKNMLPRLIEILPRKTREKVSLYSHEGEEFIYILEGILTYYYKNQKYDLYPGDSLHVHSEEMHNWENDTNDVVRLLEITIPNKFKKIEE